MGGARRRRREAVERARAGEGPSFIEAMTYRFVGPLAQSDPGAYRQPGELDGWQARDPLSSRAAG